jgi:lipoate-protein ligase A
MGLVCGLALVLVLVWIPPETSLSLSSVSSFEGVGLLTKIDMEEALVFLFDFFEEEAANEDDDEHDDDDDDEADREASEHMGVIDEDDVDLRVFC